MPTASLPMGEGLKTFFRYSPKHATLTLTVQFGASENPSSLGMASSERPIPCLRRSFAAGGQMAAARRTLHFFSKLIILICISMIQFSYQRSISDNSVLLNEESGVLIGKL